MTAQKRFGNRHQASGSGSQSGHTGLHSGYAGPGERMRMTAFLAAAILAGVMPAVGCKTGTSFTKPSWWTLGGTPKPEGDSLASAPPYGGAIAKPSESAKPYPTTTTPGGYVITGSAGPSATAAQQFEAPQSQTPVVYGSTPPPQSTPVAAGAATVDTSPIAGPQQSTLSSIAPQVGPYAALGGDSIPPPGQPLPPLAPSTSTGMSGMSGMSGAGGMSPMPSEATLPNSAYSSFSGPAASPAAVESPPARMADARGSDPAAAIPAAALPVEAAAAYGGSRYSAAQESRFAGAEPASFPAAGSPPPASYGSPAEAPLSSPPSAFPSIAPPSAVPPLSPSGPSTPGLLEPGAQPVRRPDPVYRPGGTSSYRPSRAILAEDSAPATMAVRAASYEEPAAAMQQ
jgi:hypothetical protein